MYNCLFRAIASGFGWAQMQKLRKRDDFMKLPTQKTIRNPFPRSLDSNYKSNVYPILYLSKWGKVTLESTAILKFLSCTANIYSHIVM